MNDKRYVKNCVFYLKCHIKKNTVSKWILIEKLIASNTQSVVDLLLFYRIGDQGREDAMTYRKIRKTAISIFMIIVFSVISVNVYAEDDLMGAHVSDNFLETTPVSDGYLCDPPLEESVIEPDNYFVQSIDKEGLGDEPDPDIYYNEIANDHKVTDLGVQIHTEQEIRDFINSHPSAIYNPVKYSEDPVSQYPYVLGKISDDTRESALNMLNTVRYIAGISADVINDEEYERLAQAACIADAAYGEITHYPEKVDDMDQELYELGAKGAKSSNLGVGYKTLNSAILDGWVEDVSIKSVGHRRWVLNPSMKKTGFGFVSPYSAMYAFDKNGESSQETMVAWPAQNMPVEFFSDFSSWTLSTGTMEDITAVDITLTRKSDNKTWHFNKEHPEGIFNVDNGSYGKTGCIIFRPLDSHYYKEGDRFSVTISGLKTGTVNYDVSFFSVIPRMSLTIETGRKVDIKQKCFPDISMQDVKFKISDKNLVSISNDWIKFKKPGDVEIRASVSNDVTNKDIAICDVKILSKPKLKFPTALAEEGQTVDAANYFTTSDTNTEAVTKWESSNSKIVRVIDEKKGILEAVGNGKAKITAYFGEKGQKGTIKANASITVKIPRFSKEVYKVKLNKKKTVYMKNITVGQNIDWKTADTAIATVEPQIKKGKLTGRAIVHGVSVGDTEVIAIINGREYSCTVHVSDPKINN